MNNPQPCLSVRAGLNASSQRYSKFLILATSSITNPPSFEPLRLSSFSAPLRVIRQPLPTSTHNSDSFFPSCNSLGSCLYCWTRFLQAIVLAWEYVGAIYQ